MERERRVASCKHKEGREGAGENAPHHGHQQIERLPAASHGDAQVEGRIWTREPPQEWRRGEEDACALITFIGGDCSMEKQLSDETKGNIS